MFEQAPAGLWEEGDTDQPPRSVTVRASGTGWFTGAVSSASVALTAGPLTQERPGPRRPPIKHPKTEGAGPALLSVTHRERGSATCAGCRSRPAGQNESDAFAQGGLRARRRGCCDDVRDSRINAVRPLRRPRRRAGRPPPFPFPPLRRIRPRMPRGDAALF